MLPQHIPLHNEYSLSSDQDFDNFSAHHAHHQSYGSNGVVDPLRRDGSLQHQTSNTFSFTTNGCTPGPRYVPDRSVAPDAARYVLSHPFLSLVTSEESLDRNQPSHHLLFSLSVRSTTASRAEAARHGLGLLATGRSYSALVSAIKNDCALCTLCYTADRPFCAPIVLSASLLPFLITQCAMSCPQRLHDLGVGLLGA